ncbi:Type I Iterative Polyketide synthase (PKS) [Taiwanofungus camphoratus]|nr:Type I Iterative Polyketide synthase (PKS) [Antrodia cinnamomea]
MMNAITSVAFLFDGQGTPASFSALTTKHALRDVNLPVGNALVLACHAAFLHEFDSLSTDDRVSSGIDPHEFSAPFSLLDVSPHFQTNAIIANINLYLVQLLRFLANVEPSNLGLSDPGKDSTVSPELLGFSAGVFAATVIAASSDIPSFILNAVETFRLAFWLGFRCQTFAVSSLSAQGMNDLSAPWSLVLFGSTYAEIQEAVDHYNIKHASGTNIYITAVTNTTCISISGRPDAISEFRENYVPSSSTTSRFAAIHTLYHSPELEPVKAHVMEDLARRHVRFPMYEDLKRPLRSPINGELIDATHKGTDYPLVEAIVDMTLLHPVRFDRVVDAIRSDISSRKLSLQFVNVGPGSGLWRSVARATRDLGVSTADWTSLADTDPYSSSLSQAIPSNVPRQEPIAIVGMAVNFPGAPDAEGLWKVLENGLNTVSEVPANRFDVSAYTNAPKGSKRTMKTKLGSFLDNADVFDNAFFRMSPREARSMDPQQRVLLHVAYHALENAGYVPNATPCFNPDTFATYVGVATNDYVQNLRNDIDVYYSTGTLQAFLSGKVSYAFGFSGPSMVIDTACSSSMVAIHQACRSLAIGDCSAAIAGGVNVMASPDMYLGLDRAHFLSATGQCRPWDASADGYCRAEGCGMFVLKRLSDALAENDSILGVIRGVELNQCGQAESITHPHAPTQIELFKKVLASTGVHPSRISVVEAHGTGTQAGDPTELESLRAVLAVNRSSDNPLHVTSVKANIGHAEAASGAAALAKLILMMRKRVIPAVISLKQLNPRIPELSIDGTCIDTEPTTWTTMREGEKRLALLSNFGAAGSNSALVLEEPPTPQLPMTIEAPGAVILGLSCESAAAAEQLRESYVHRIMESVDDQFSLADFAYTATARRQLYRYRIAAYGRSKEDLCSNLKEAQLVEVKAERGKVVFLFSGQGGQYLGMGTDLYRSIPAFRQKVDQCHRKLTSWGYPGILGIINPSSEDSPDSGATGSFEAFQSAVFVLESALASLWMSWGIQPDAVAGHSLGEYAALVIANVISFDDALRMVAERARLMSQKCELGATGMLAVRLSPERVTDILSTEENYQGLAIACYNSNADCVVAGHVGQLEFLYSKVKQSGNKCLRLNVPYGYHTSAMHPILDDLRQLGARLKLSAPSIPILSNVHGVVVSAGDASVFTSDYFARHCGEAVRFEQSIQQLVTQKEFSNIAAWIEIGPHPTTLPMIRSINLAPKESLQISSLRKDASDWETLSSALSSLYCIPTSIAWRNVYADFAPNARPVELPSYPFANTRFWVAFEEDRPHSAPGVEVHAPSTQFSLLGSCVSVPSHEGDVALFETTIDRLANLIEGHEVAGHALCPASVYHELALAAAHTLLEKVGTTDQDMVLDLSEIVYAHPLVYSPRVPRTVRIEVAPLSSGDKHSGKFNISSWIGDSRGESQPHCSGFFDKRSANHTASKLSLSKTMINRRRESARSGSNRSETFYTHTAYNIIFSRVVKYASAYHTMKSITVDANGVDAFAVIQLPSESASGRFVVHPIFMDTLLHAAGFVINCNAGDNEAFICSQVDRVKGLPALIKTSATYGVYCNIGFMSDTLAVADAYAIELDGADGTVVAHMKRMRFRKLRKNGFSTLLSMAAQDPAHAHTAAPRHSSRQSAAHAPSSRENANTSSKKESGIEAQLVNLVAETCGVNIADMKMQSRLSDLGFDSLMSIELAGRINALLPSLHLDADALSSYNQVGDLVQDIKHKCGSSTPTSSTVTLIEPDVASSDHAVASTHGAAERAQVKEIMSSILGISVEELADDQDLERLGLDSLTSIEARHALQSTLDVKISEEAFSSCKTIRDLVVAVLGPASDGQDGVRGSKQETDKRITFGTEVNPAPYQDGNGSDSLPLFLIHDGSGMAHPYSRLLPLGRALWGIHNPNLPTGEEWKGGVLEMAAHYVGLIKAVAGRTGCIVGGWSFGGVLAFEVGRQLIDAGVRVPGIVLIDSPHPLTRSPLPPSLIDSVIGEKGSGNRLTQLVRTQMRHATQALVQYDPSQSPACHVMPKKAVMLRSREGFPLAKVETESASFLADRNDPAKSVVEWEKVLGTAVPVLDIPGNHFEPFEAKNIPTVSQKLKEALVLLD